MRGWLASIAAFLLMLMGFGVWVWNAPPPPFTQTTGLSEVGAKVLTVVSIAPFDLGDAVVIDYDTDLLVTRVEGIDPETSKLVLSDPVPFRILDRHPAQVSRREIATPYAVFDKSAGVRKLPRVDSRVIAYTQKGARHETEIIGDEWVKLKLRPPSRGWTAMDGVTINESGVVPEARYSKRVAARYSPYADESEVEWEGRVVRNIVAEEDGETVYRIVAANAQSQERTISVVKATHDSLRETEYFVLKTNGTLVELPPPVAYTEIGAPYEVLDQRGDALLIELLDQGWVRRADCAFEAAYEYSLTRRQGLNAAARERIAKGW